MKSRAKTGVISIVSLLTRLSGCGGVCADRGSCSNARRCAMYEEASRSVSSFDNLVSAGTHGRVVFSLEEIK